MCKGNAIGLDDHMQSVHVAVLDSSGRVLANRSCGNDWREVRRLAERYGPVGRAAIEACCGAADLAEELVERAGWHVELAHPGYVARLKQTPDKTDFTDAELLADLTRVGYLPRVWLAPARLRELRRLVRHRASLVDDRRRIKQRLGAILRDERIGNHSGASTWTKRWLEWLRTLAPLSEAGRFVVLRQLRQIEFFSEEIKAAEAHLETLTRDDSLVNRLRREKGIGPVTAWVLRAEIGRFDRFKTGKQLSRYCGLSPCNASSGSRMADSGLIKASSPLLRTTLIEAAHQLKRCDPRWCGLAEKLKKRGKPGSVIAGAIANRWMRSLFNRLKKECLMN